jgi:hypothetical protein
MRRGWVTLRTLREAERAERESRFPLGCASTLSPERVRPERDEQFDPLSTEKVVNAGGTVFALSSLYPSAISAKGWSVYGAQRAQPVATGRKWEGAENG